MSGEGSTAQQKAMEHFSQILSDDSDIVLDYTGSGSGDGIKKFIAGDVDFAGSDSALKGDEITKAKDRCNGNDAWHLPMVVGPVAVAYNLEGVDDLKLNPAVIAKIFNGKITKWNDPAIAALNPGAQLPGGDIVPVYRSDSSGTTDNFQRFLQNSAPNDWPYEHSKEFAPKNVGSGASKSTGVGDTVKKTPPGSISYVEWGLRDREQARCRRHRLRSGSGRAERGECRQGPRRAGVQEPGQQGPRRRHRRAVRVEDPGCYPLLLTPYSIVCSAGYSDEATSATLKDAFTKILGDGQTGLAEIGYVPVPQNFKAKLQGSIDALAGSGNA